MDYLVGCMSSIFFCVTNFLFEKFNGVGHPKFQGLRKYLETICSYKIPESAVKRISGIFAVCKNCGYHAHILWKIPLKYALID